MLPHFMGGQSDKLVRIMRAEINFVRDWWLVVHQDLNQSRAFERLSSLSQVQCGATIVC